MSSTIRLSHEYEATADAVWAVAIDWKALATMSASAVSYRGLPTGVLSEGQVAEFEISAFGIMPWSPYQVEVVEVSAAERRFVSHENGGMIKLWRHVMTIEETPTGARQSDVIEIDAGFMTWFVVILAKRMYAKRDAPRRALLGLPPR